MKVSKVVLIVVALHVLVIGGIFIFEGCSRAKAPAPDMAENESPATNDIANQPAVPADTAQNLTPVPPTAPTAVPPATTVAKTYVVKKGDSLWKIAKAEKVSIIELTKANNLSKTSALKVGQKLQVPSKTEAVAAAATETPATATAAAPATSESSLYVVKSGDSLWKIARSQNITVASLKQANSLASDSLKVGQKLHIPTATASAKPATTTTTASAATAPVSAGSVAYSDWHEPGTAIEGGQTIHYVDIGESPALIAKKYSVKVDDLMKANNISDARRIVVGQKLIIPTQQSAAPAAAAKPTPTASPAVAAPIVSGPPVAAAN